MHKSPIALLIAAFRGARLTCHLLYAGLLACIYPLLGLSIRQFILKRWSSELLGILQIQLEISRFHPPHVSIGALLVANHVSWLDVFALNSVLPSCFIAKSEVRAWPLLGLLCSRAKTIFIERDIRRDTLHTNRRIAETLAQGECVALFPEGTSTDGTLLRHFHSSLLQGAIDAKAAIYPVAIRYHDGTGKLSNDAAFVGDMTFIQSLQQILCSPSLHATLIILPELSCIGKNRRVLAAEAQTAIQSALDRPAPYHCATSAAPIFDSRRNGSGYLPSAYSLLLDPILKFKKKHSS